MSSCLTTRDLLLLSQTQQQRSPPRHTSNHMSNSQCEKLVDLCREYYDIISDTGNSIESRTQRRRIWELIANQLNEKGKTNFTPAQYKKKYQNLKTSLKAKMNAIKRSQAIPVPGGGNNNNDNINAKKISEASTSSERTSAFGSPLGFTPLPTPLGFPPSFFQTPVVTQTTTVHHPTPISFSALAAAATPSASSEATGTQQIFAPIPQMGIPTLNLQSLMSSIAANEQAAAAAAAAAAGRSPVPLEPGTSALLSPAAMQSPKSEPDTMMSSPGAELHETLALADADPVDVFCMSLSESLSRIKSVNALLYTQLKRDISVLVLDAEIQLLEKEEASL